MPMRNAYVFVNGIIAGVLTESEDRRYQFKYEPAYQGPPVSLTMPVQQAAYHYDSFPSFFEGLLPEGVMLDGLLRKSKLDRNDFFGQLIAVGKDVVGAVTIEAVQ